MLRMIKYGVGGLAAVVLTGFLVFGSDLTSMIRTGAKSVQKTVKRTVPVEFELKRAKETINQILPDMQSQVRMIAEEEVAIARLAKEVNEDERHLESQQAKLSALRDKMRTQQVSYQVGRVQLDRQQLAKHLQVHFDHFKQASLSLESKQKLLEKRKQGLAAALTMLDQMRCRQSELELKVEALAAQHRLIKASQIESGKLIDGSQLSKADQLLDEIETRLQVAQRVMEYQNDALDTPAPEVEVEEQAVLSEFDQYFGSSADATIARVKVAEAH